ncbi:MAG TPA: triose-phosphate isomerase [Candidatus Limnocylindria bacterium]|nr:triose-phosphate isomerase [Candidatus Limnocylindria bacterium]
MREFVVAGNWKMNPTSVTDAATLARAVRDAADGLPSITAVVCPPTIWLRDVAQAAGGGPLRIGAQTMHWEDAGAYTGETSPAMLVGTAELVIVGHSERRQYDNETDEKVGRKTASAIAHGLRPIVAVGERAEERRAGQTEAVVERQVRAALAHLDRIAGTGLIVAYEPVWAIGTGDAASGADAQAVAHRIREIVRELDPAAADEVPIQYGGSCTPENAAEFFAQPDVDGALVGGASLKADAFAAILRAAADASAARG